MVSFILHLIFLSARKIWPLLELLAKIRWVLACSCSQNFCNYLSNARARKNKHSGRMLADAHKDHSIYSIISTPTEIKYHIRDISTELN